MASATSLQDESDKLYPVVNTTACRGAGVPGSKSVLTWKDAVTLLIVLGSSLGSIVAVYVPAAAVSLGQINQLVVVGFCLAIMAICTARQITLASIMYDVHKGQSSLHDFEALLRNDFWGEHARIRTKAIIFLITTIPLGLSIGYKRFVGGNSSINMPASGGEFGFAMPHGYRRVGLGIGLSMNQYFPYWQDPAVNRTYGFALYVESNTTAGILDTPFASYFSSLQSKVRGEDAILVSAAVNATVSESAPFDMSDLTDNGWKALEKKFTPSWKNETFNDGHFMLWASQIVHNHSSLDVKISNTSRTVLSIWNMNQTDRSQARQLFTNRREAYGTWKITSSNITLQSAEFLPQTPQTRDWSRQKIIQDNMMVTDLQLLREYDYMRYPRATDLDTTPALVSTAIASLIAGTNRYKTTEDFSFWDYNENAAVRYWGNISHYNKTGSEIQIVHQRVSLRRNPLLLLILLVQPVLVLLGVTIKMWLWDTPVDENVGLVSLLAAVEPETLQVLEGASLSGKLSRRVDMRFVVEENRIVVQLDNSGAHHVRKGMIYS